MMTPFSHTIKLKPGQICYIIPLGDVHYNVVQCDRRRFHDLIRWVSQRVAEGAVVRIIGMGDYIDPLSPSERAALVGAKGGQGLHDTTLATLDGLANDLATDFVRAVWPVRKSFLGLLEGHHYMYYSGGPFKGRTTTEYIAEWLGCAYFGDIIKGNLWFSPERGKKLKFGIEGNAAGLRLGVVAHHGWGSGRTKGARLSKRERFGADHPDAHLVFMGHDHEKMIGEAQRLVIDYLSPDGIADHKQYLIGTGSFLKGYDTGDARGTYVEKVGLPPAGLGVVIVKVQIEKRDGKWRLDFHASI